MVESAVRKDGDFVSYIDSLPEMLNETLMKNGRVRVFMGNEAADADSIVSSLTLGYAESMKPSKAPSELMVPVVSAPRADLSLRRDVVILLDIAGINPENLLYIDDEIVVDRLLSPPVSGKEDPRSITLTDHNRIRSSLRDLAPLVTEIVDHHEDSGHHSSVTVESGRRSIAFDGGKATVASTCTLVTELLLDDQSPGGNGNKIDGSLGLLLLGVILLDSVNMIPAAGKGTDRDERAISTLGERTDWAQISVLSPSIADASVFDKIFPEGRARSPSQDALFDLLSGARNDPKFWAGLSTLDSLRIDYKRFEVPGSSKSSPIRTIGLSSVLTDMDSLLSKDNFENDMRDYQSSCQVDLFGALTLEFVDGNLNRELLLSSPKVGVLEGVTNYLLRDKDAASIQLNEREDLRTASKRVFRQGNAKCSRKQVAPLLQRAALSLNLKSDL